MPELPEVETVRRGLTPVLVGHRLTRVVLRRPDLRFPLPEGFAARLRDRRVEAVDRRGKFLLIRLEGGLVLIAHLGMSGRFRVFEDPPPPPEAHDHVLFEIDRGASLRFHDPRRFGFMDLVGAAALDRHPMLAALGPEPLGEGFDGAFLAERLRGKRSPLKAAILDQRIVAGMGNIYACESLYRARLSPTRVASTITGSRATRLATAIRAVLEEAIAAGGSTLRDHRRPSGELGYFQHRFAVYARAGMPCPDCDCDLQRTGGIRRVVQAGRSTFHCAKRQS
ncbi:MAG: bifunctional DNA-formamidopyrimidine glycosylase/DNA-(apurinic or apyrimidinic site) lyase [Rhodospirillales bacterium]